MSDMTPALGLIYFTAIVIGVFVIWLVAKLPEWIADAMHERVNLIIREIIRDYGNWAKANHALNNAFETLGHQVNDHNIAIARCVAYIEKQEQK